MTTLAKCRKRRHKLGALENQLLTPWNGKFTQPCRKGNCSSNLNQLAKLTDVVREDFYSEKRIMPAMNTKENETELELEFAIPGFDKKDFEVSVNQGVLHISGEKKLEEKEEVNNYTYNEFRYQAFTRSVLLSPSVDFNQDVKASYQNGILNLKFLKKQEIKENQAPRKIINVN